MDLGAFSVSLNVRDINTSVEFYLKLGFSVFAGSPEEKYVIMKNKGTLLGLFEGMLDQNILTFNPGWDQDAKELPEFSDIREIKKNILSGGISVEHSSIERDSGPGSFMVTDPDGNKILLDQHR